MNLAFGTILIFLILLPGVFFRLTLYYGEYSKRFTKTTAFDEFIWALIPGFAIQLFSAWLTNIFTPFNYFIEFSNIGILLVGAKEDKNIQDAFQSVGQFIGPIILYNTLLISIMGLLGFLTRYIIRHNHLDHIYKAARFSNEWFYLLRGEFVFFQEERILNIQRIDNCFIDSLVKVGNDLLIYRGIIHSFNLGKDGILENVIVTGARRRKFTEKEYYILPGQIIILKFSEIVNIHIHVIDLSNANINSASNPEATTPSAPTPAPPPSSSPASSE